MPRCLTRVKYRASNLLRFSKFRESEAIERQPRCFLNDDGIYRSMAKGRTAEVRVRAKVERDDLLLGVPQQVRLFVGH